MGELPSKTGERAVLIISLQIIFIIGGVDYYSFTFWATIARHLIAGHYRHRQMQSIFLFAIGQSTHFMLSFTPDRISAVEITAYHFRITKWTFHKITSYVIYFPTQNFENISETISSPISRPSTSPRADIEHSTPMQQRSRAIPLFMSSRALSSASADEHIAAY